MQEIWNLKRLPPEPSEGTCNWKVDCVTSERKSKYSGLAPVISQWKWKWKWQTIEGILPIKDLPFAVWNKQKRA